MSLIMCLTLSPLKKVRPASVFSEFGKNWVQNNAGRLFSTFKIA